MDAPTLLVTAAVEAEHRRLIEDELPSSVDCRYLSEIAAEQQTGAVSEADGLLSWNPDREFTDGMVAELHGEQIMQAVSAGVDHFPLDRLPEGVVLQSNAGAYAEPMAEHVLALYLALSKRLRIEHQKLQDGAFDQFEPNRRIDGSTCGIVGYGATGEAAARRLKALGVSVFGINRHGEAEKSPAFLGTPDDLEYVLRQSDGVVLAAPLTPETRGLIDREKLRWMDADAMLINVARGELVNQRDLYHHLQATPQFQAGIDAWWTEPVRHGTFELEYPFLDLPNVIGSPHNAAQVPDIEAEGLRQAVRTVGRAIETGELENVVDRELGY